MKSMKPLLLLLFSGILLFGCSPFEDTRNEISLNEVVSSYDLWYVDYNSTTGTGEVPFLSKAFTISFVRGRLYANNNITDVGRTGNGLGIVVGNYNANRGGIEVNHNLDGNYYFEVYQIAPNRIKIYNSYENVSYYLIGYQRADFDYDKLFYDNIEYFLQEYVAWGKLSTVGGNANPFDAENYLQFTPENLTTFYSSKDSFGTTLDYINWSFVGDYKVFDIQGYDDLKILTLNYDGGDTEEFELSVINDSTIQLYHYASDTTYLFKGLGFIQYLKNSNPKQDVRNTDRKRTKVKREIKVRRHLK